MRMRRDRAPPTQPARRRPTPRLDDYPHRVNDIIRYGDLDPQGHVNNAVFATYFESGRVAMFRTARSRHRRAGC